MTTQTASRPAKGHKRKALWLLALILPALPLAAGAVILITGEVLWGLLVLAVDYALLPLLDVLVGEDRHNPQEADLEHLAADPWYRRLLLGTVPLFFASFAMAAYVVGTQDLPVLGVFVLALGTGVSSGVGLTVAHELGHKSSRVDRFAAKLLSALTGYSHFCLEHNRGHHSWVATPEDPASSRLGESVYRFFLREIPGAARGGWRFERERLANKGHGFWHWRNDILQGYAMTLAIAVGLIAAFGWIMLFFLLVHHIPGWLQLSMANYIEHYGLLREKRPDGRYEPCRPEHSWNTNFFVSNIALFHLQRHSDHHLNPQKPYQALRDFDDLPRLPTGYPGCYLVAFIPRLWFRMMDPKVMRWAGGDLSKVNRVAGYEPRGWAK